MQGYYEIENYESSYFYETSVKSLVFLPVLPISRTKMDIAKHASFADYLCTLLFHPEAKFFLVEIVVMDMQ